MNGPLRAFNSSFVTFILHPQTPHTIKCIHFNGGRAVAVACMGRYLPDSTSLACELHFCKFIPCSISFLPAFL